MHAGHARNCCPCRDGIPITTFMPSCRAFRTWCKPLPCNTVIVLPCDGTAAASLRLTASLLPAVVATEAAAYTALTCRGHLRHQRPSDLQNLPGRGGHWLSSIVLELQAASYTCPAAVILGTENTCAAELQGALALKAPVLKRFREHWQCLNPLQIHLD